MDVAVLPALAADSGSHTPAAKSDPPSLPIPLPADSAPAELDPAQLDTLLDRLRTILNDETADNLPALLVAHITSVPADSLLSSRTEYGAAVLHAAAYYGHIDVVRAVLSAIRSLPTAQTAPVVRASAWMPSPLMLASARGDVDMVQVLLDFPGAHVNEQFPLTGWTALGFCCCATAGHPVATAALLLANGADPAIPAWSARAMHDVGEWDPRLLVPSASPVSAAALGGKRQVVVWTDRLGPGVVERGRQARRPTWRSKLSLSVTFPSLRRSNTATSPASGSASGSGSVVSPSSSSPASSSKGAAVVPSATSSGSSPLDALDASNRALLAKFGLGSAP
ncbi:hypothetical protein AMAG_07198 [Allomyces macrogynus ATCC 38327]|uniref:Uncharacterized protein n=1 Tax=Allomyces macrogynus (strain ATCC 38327) TaxID=578462 RepID=A0A0L0SHR7_ALLM3|nr:hypothetical protein AMAG_07198 [Allomyces macrogynus ATCC 38327]|eukprot:KNE61930.1 hypothetical protein AMAG_07198 [Allomyces macrogynus ATCC 38327]